MKTAFDNIKLLFVGAFIPFVEEEKIVLISAINQRINCREDIREAMEKCGGTIYVRKEMDEYDIVYRPLKHPYLKFSDEIKLEIN
jgi:hypothetical protein